MDEKEIEKLEKTKKEMDKVMEERILKKPNCKNYMEKLKFKSSEDLEAFNMLPISEYEKEQMILELYPEYKEIFKKS